MFISDIFQRVSLNHSYHFDVTVSSRVVALLLNVVSSVSLMNSEKYSLYIFHHILVIKQLKNAKSRTQPYGTPIRGLSYEELLMIYL